MIVAQHVIVRARQTVLSTAQPTLAPARSLSCYSTGRSSSQTPPPPAPVTKQDSAERLYRKVIKTAVLGAYELSHSAIATGSSPAARGFQPPKLRNTPNSERGTRARLVRVDPVQVVRNGHTRRPTARTARTPPGPASSKRFSTTCNVARAPEDTFELEDMWLESEGGDFDAASDGNRARIPKPGDWVETRRNGQPSSGIYLSLGTTSARRFMILPVNGERTELSLDDITYVLPGVIPAALASSASFANAPEFLPSSPQALEMLQKLRQIEFAIEEETKVLVYHGVHDLRRILESPSPASSKKAKSSASLPATSTTISTAVRALGLAPMSTSTTHAFPLARQIAMHRFLLDNAVHFLADGLALRISGKFDLRDPKEVDRFERVRHWTRSQSPEIVGFAEKAAKIREHGRLNPPETTSADGTLQVRKLPDSSTFVWTKEEQEILQFLRDTLAYDRALQMQPHMAVAPSILKLVDQQTLALGLSRWDSELEIKKGGIRDFLSQVGETAPWENWAALEKSTGLENWEQMSTQVGRALDRANSKPSKTTLTSTSFYPQDPHDAIRRDFGDMTVYTIDDAGAFELDDGISLAPAPPTASGKTTHWVYVHIADPTALLHTGHLVAKLARVRDHTVYFPEKTWGMLPDNFVEDQKLSLGSQNGEPQRVMSFGMRIEEDTGEVIESNVQVGVIRKVLRLTYAGVDSALGQPAPPPKKGIKHSVSFTTETASSAPATRRRHIDDDALATDDSARAQLRTLHQLSGKLLARRSASTAMFWNFPSASVSVSNSLSPSFTTSSRPTFYASSPNVELFLPSVHDRAFVESPANLLVSEMMVAANRTAAKFSVENGLHVPFRVQGGPSGSPEAIEALLKLRDPKTGQADAVDVLKTGVDFVPGANTPTTGSHWPMGINDDYGYVKVTSPLRRFSDLFSHWQLKSALSPASSLTTPRFDLPSVLQHIRGFDAVAKARHRLSDSAVKFWSLFVISHKLSLLNQLESRTNALSTTDLSAQDSEFVQLLSGGLTAIPLRIAAHSSFDNKHVQPIVIPQLGVTGTLQVDRLDQAPQIGEEVPIKIDDVILSARSKVVVSRR
ncbi:ribonuclease catalytic domain-containing protein [Sporobolomyces koalae]|uniref:ribonuclease catalytic domain-containing protein n=1 Tax=Sporobolomyces koalae TaxID=500713 RepID=UPI003173B55F